MRLRFRGHPLRAALLGGGERVAVLHQDVYEGHFKDLWLWVFRLDDGLPERTALLLAAHGHAGDEMPLAVDGRGRRVFAPVETIAEVWDLDCDRRLTPRAAPRRAWDPLRDWRRGPRPVRCGTLDARGATLWVGDGDVRLRAWDLDSGAERVGLREASGPIQCVAVAPDGASLAVATSSRLKLWDTARGTVLAGLGDVNGRTMSLVFHPSGRWLVSAGSSSRLQLWDIERRRCARTWPALVERAALDPRGEWLAGVEREPHAAGSPAPSSDAYAAALCVWSTASGVLVASWSFPRVNYARWEVPSVECYGGADRLIVIDGSEVIAFGEGANDLEPAPDAAALELDRGAIRGVTANVAQDAVSAEGDAARGLAGVPVAVWRAGATDWVICRGAQRLVQFGR